MQFHALIEDMQKEIRLRCTRMTQHMLGATCHRERAAYRSNHMIWSPPPAPLEAVGWCIEDGDSVNLLSFMYHDDYAFTSHEWWILHRKLMRAMELGRDAIAIYMLQHCCNPSTVPGLYEHVVTNIVRYKRIGLLSHVMTMDSTLKGRLSDRLVLASLGLRQFDALRQAVSQFPRIRPVLLDSIRELPSFTKILTLKQIRALWYVTARWSDEIWRFGTPFPSVYNAHANPWILDWLQCQGMHIQRWCFEMAYETDPWRWYAAKKKKLAARKAYRQRKRTACRNLSECGDLWREIAQYLPRVEGIRLAWVCRRFHDFLAHWTVRQHRQMWNLGLLPSHGSASTKEFRRFVQRVITIYDHRIAPLIPHGVHYTDYPHEPMQWNAIIDFAHTKDICGWSVYITVFPSEAPVPGNAVNMWLKVRMLARPESPPTYRVLAMNQPHYVTLMGSMDDAVQALSIFYADGWGRLFNRVVTFQ